MAVTPGAIRRPLIVFLLLVISAGRLLDLNASIGEALDQPELDWASGEGANNLITVNSPEYVDGDALVFKRLGDASQAWIETSISGPATIGFRWRIRQILGSSGLSLSIDGQEESFWSATSNWSNQQVTIQEGGTHTLRWTFWDSEYEPSEDTIWLDALTIRQSPIITEQPHPIAVSAGGSTTLSVIAEEFIPTTYQWKFNGQPIASETNSTLEISNAALSDSGWYSVEIANANGVTQSDAAIVSVYENLGNALEQSDWDWTVSGLNSWHPQSAGSFDGDDALEFISLLPDYSYNVPSASLKTTVEGPGEISFYWKYKPSFHSSRQLHFKVNGNQVSSAPISNTWTKYTHAILGSGPQSVEWELWLQGFSNTNLEAKLDYIQFERKPLVVEQPSGQLVPKSAPVSLSVSVTSATPVAYQWRKNGADLAGETAETLNIDSASSSDSGLYDVLIVNSEFETISNPANVLVIEPVEEAFNQSELDWDTDGSPQWYLSTEIAYDGTLALEGRDRQAKLVTSVEGPVTISFWWRSETSLDYAPFQFQTNGYSRPLTRNAVGWTQETFVLPEPGPHELRWEYWPINTSANRLWLDQLELDYSPIIQNSPSDASAALGSETYFDVIVVSTSEVAYQWLKNGDELPDETQSSLTISGVSEQDIAAYSVRVSNVDGSVTSSPASLTVYDNFGESVEQPGLSWVFGSQRNWFSTTDQGLGGGDAAAFRSNPAVDYISDFMETTLTGPLRMNFWWRTTGEPGLHSQLRVDQQTALIAPVAGEGWVNEEFDVDTQGDITVQFATTSFESIFSELLIDRIHISHPPSIQSQPVNQTVFIGESIGLSVEAISATTLSYQWYRNGEMISGATESALSIPSASITDSGVYKVSLSNEDDSVFSRSAQIRVSAPFEEALDTEAVAWTSSEDSNWYTQPRSPTEESLALQTQISNRDEIAWLQTEIQGPAMVSFDWKGEFDDGQLSFLVNGEYKAWIQESLDWQTGSASILESGLHTLRWELSSSSNTGLQQAWLDSVRISQAPVISKQPQSLLIGDSQAATLSVEAVSESTISYQWNKDGNPIAGENSSTLNLDNLVADSGTYEVVLTNNKGSATSRQVEVAPLNNINEGLDTSGQSWITTIEGRIELQSNQTYDQEDAIVLHPDNEIAIETSINGPAIVELKYRIEYVNGGGVIGLLGDNTLPLEPVDFRWQSLQAVVDEEGPITLKFTAYGFEGQEPKTRLYLDQLRIQKSPVIVRQPEPGLLTAGAPSELSVLVNNASSVTYQWRKDGSPISGADQASYSIPNPSQSDSGIYDVVVSNGAGDTFSKQVPLLYESDLQAALDLTDRKVAFGGTGSVSIDPYIRKIGESSLRFEAAPGEVIWLEALSDQPSKVSFWWKRIDQCANASIRSNDQYLGYSDPSDGTDWQYFEWSDSQDDENPFLWVFSPIYECDAIFFLDGLKIEYDPILSQPDEIATVPGEPLRIDIDWRNDFSGPIQWRRNGVDLPGQTSPNLRIDTFQEGDKGSYDVAYTFGGVTSYSNPIDVVSISNIGQPIEAQDLIWTVGDTGEWTYDTDESWTGGESLRMRSENQFELPWIETVVEGPALVSFSWLIEWNSCDKIFFYVNGEEKRGYSRRTSSFSWREEEYYLADAGPHVLRWGWTEKDCDWRTTAWLDNLQIERGPRFLSNPKSTTFERGRTASLSVEPDSNSDAIQWRLNGLPIPGATDKSLIVSSPGEYDVIATNSFGSTYSSVAVVSEMEAVGQHLEQTSMNWEARSDIPWFPNYTIVSTGESSLSSPEFPLGGVATLTALARGPTTLSFDYRIVGTPNNIRARLIVAGIGSFDLDDRINELGTDWNTYNVSIEEEGLFEITWSTNVERPRERFGVVTPYGNAPNLLIDNVRISNQPLFVANPRNVNVEQNSPLLLNARAIGPNAFGPIRYQWYKNGSPIPQATTDSLFIESVDETASYWLQATNTAGSANSEIAVVALEDSIRIGEIAFSTSSKSLWRVVEDQDVGIVFRSSLSPTPGEAVQSILNANLEGPGTLAFTWRKSSIHSGNLAFSIDGELITSRSTSVSPIRQRLYIRPGQHYLEWALSTNSDLVSGWVYDIEFEQGTPHVELAGFPRRALSGSNVVVNPNIISDSPITSYQWYFNEEPMPGETNATLALNNIDQSNVGAYQLHVTNDIGTGKSALRNLEVWDLPLFAIGQNPLSFSFAGSGNWEPRIDSRGISRIYAPSLRPGQSTAMTTEIEGPSQIEFEIGFFSQVPGVVFEFLIDGKIVFAHDSGRVDGVYHHEIKENGLHQLEWRVTNDNPDLESNAIGFSHVKVSSNILGVYEEWGQLLFNDQAPASITHPQSDPDGDTKSNILEFLLGTDPLTADGAIAIGVFESEGETYWQSTLELIAWLDGIEFRFETSSDSRSWEPIETKFDLQDDGQRAKVELKALAPITSGEFRYTRIRLLYPTTRF